MNASDGLPTLAAGIPALGTMLVIAGVALLLGVVALWLARRHTRRERAVQDEEARRAEATPPPDETSGR